MKRTHFIFLSACTLLLNACNKPAPAVEAELSGFELHVVPGTEFYLVTKSSNGIKTQEGYVLAGKKNGLWLDYGTDGRIIQLQHFIDGKLNGPVLNMDNRSQVTAKTDYVNDVYHGAKVTYKFGRPLEEIPYVNGKIHGVMKKYYTNNKLMEEAEYKDNVQDGYYRHYNEEGVIDLEYVYKNGEKVSGGIVTPPSGN